MKLRHLLGSFRARVHPVVHVLLTKARVHVNDLERGARRGLRLGKSSLLLWGGQ